MPGYYDWKLRNCSVGAKTKAQSLISTFDEVDPYLIRIWEGQGGEFTAEQIEELAGIVGMIDAAEDSLEEAKLALGKFFPGKPAPPTLGHGKDI